MRAYERSAASEVTRMGGDKKIKHHGFAHLVLTALLFLASTFAFGGWSKGPITSGLAVGLRTYAMVSGGISGNISALDAGPTVLAMIIAFIINLVVYYIIAAILIFVFNLLFSHPKGK